MNEITIGDKTYVSSKRAAEITGYAKDYIGQLCREGRVEARLIGRNWYISDSALRAHRFGEEETPSAAPETKVEAIPSIDALWDAPRYGHESVEEVHEAAEPVEPIRQDAPEPERKDAAIPSDMHAAWSEWFSARVSPQKGATEPQAAAEEAEAPENAGESEGVSVHISKIREDLPQDVPLTASIPVEDEHESVRISRIATETAQGVSNSREAQLEEEEAPYPAYAKTRGQGISSTGLAVRSALVLAAVVAVFTAVLGTGFVRIPESVLNNAAALQMLSGTRTLIK
ncbi:MAG: hypothetical protein KGI41_02190 [Patescibacteria group bacterium]|nr:hypothetical protein [Patescibacteria group bacterium]